MGKFINFKECRDGHYYHEFVPDNSNKSKNTVNDCTTVQTGKGKKSYFTKEEIKNEDRARRVKKVIGWPSNTTLKSITKEQLICNSDINIYDINREYII